uniref:GDP-mannose 4,6-dehydratase n=1 Tax=Saccharothrix mutabilis subsp. capreolus TaxID=66854 RepID=Q8RJX3_STRMP|nr:Ata12 protein [Saccharothrix mutabilis subsp. capreolus]
MSRRALITGITGQDGSYLAEHLLAEGYEVWGVVRGQDAPGKPWIRPLLNEVRLLQGDLLDQRSLIEAVDQAQPDEVYNLGAISYVPLSWKQAEITSEVTGLGVLRILEAIRTVSGIGGNGGAGGGSAGGVRFYQASSSEMFGQVEESPQNERTRFHPRSPYAVAKTYGHYLTQNYRESFGMHCVSGILFNHESPRRGPEFVTRKISLGVARIKLGLAGELRLGNLEARRDWGFAGDYVRAMHLMLQQPVPRDYVIGTGRTHSVREAVEIAFAAAGLDWRRHVVVDPGLVRPADVELLCADASLARRDLDWKPETEFAELMEAMVESDLRLVARTRSDDPA